MAHSDAEVGEALIRLAANKYDFAKTAKEVGVAVSTLRVWTNSRPKKGVLELLDRALERCLMRVDEVPAKELPVLMGILFDKWLLTQGEPTSRTETIAREVANLTPTEQDAVIAEARAIIAEARSRRVAAGNGQSE
jgi:hypothetical protein